MAKKCNQLDCKFREILNDTVELLKVASESIHDSYWREQLRTQSDELRLALQEALMDDWDDAAGEIEGDDEEASPGGLCDECGGIGFFWKECIDEDDASDKLICSACLGTGEKKG